ncbi:MAG: Smr/MutS family protein [Bacilli bacterium]|nr:Smr/MutS family protein [Bacilli bacterium]
MNLNSLITYDNLPKLDLHGLDRDCAVMYVKFFIEDNIKLKNQFILIVHGVGQGILKKATHDYLKKNKNVIEYKTIYYNMGALLSILKFDK